MSNESTLGVVGNNDDSGYNAFVGRMQQRFLSNTADNEPLFTTDVEDLFERYLGSFPEMSRQYHNCNACKRFIERFGGLVTIDKAGNKLPAFWHLDDAPPAYQPAVKALFNRVMRAKVTGVFLTKEKVWGTPITGPWTHFALHASGRAQNKNSVLSASQAMAEKLEDYKNVQRALSEFSLETLEQAVALLQSESLYRSEKVLGPAQWLYDLHVAQKAYMHRSNVLWRAVATAPVGFCHPRSSMIGTLLEDLQSGMLFEDVARRFYAKMHPLQYQRPQVAPAAGNIQLQRANR